MNLTSAERIERGLTAAQNKRKIQYQASLSEEKDRQIFDSDMKKYLLSVSSNPRKILEEISFLDSNDWNQSHFKPDMIKEQYLRFSADNHPYFAKNLNFMAAKSKLEREVENWDLKTLRYFCDSDIERALPRKDTHAGFSFIETGLKSKGEYMEGIFQAYVLEENKARKEGSFNKIIMIGTRTQASPPYNKKTGKRTVDYNEIQKSKKSRLVSMEDIYLILAECKFANNFQKRLGLTDWYAGGKSDAQILHHVTDGRDNFRNWISIDYSAYDQSCSDWMIREAFDIIRLAYRKDLFWDEELFKIVREDFIKKVFLTPDGLIESRKGVPSGSMFTQIIDSLINRLMIETYMIAKKIDRYKMMIMGDDNIIFSNQELDLEDLASYLSHNFGVTMHPKKCDSGTSRQDDPYFLSRFWTRRGAYRRPEILIAKLCYPERFREYKRYGFTPAMIVQSYIESFPLGMKEFIDKEEHDYRVHEERRKFGSAKYLTGLALYREMYGA